MVFFLPITQPSCSELRLIVGLLLAGFGAGLLGYVIVSSSVCAAKSAAGYSMWIQLCAWLPVGSAAAAEARLMAHDIDNLPLGLGFPAELYGRYHDV